MPWEMSDSPWDQGQKTGQSRSCAGSHGRFVILAGLAIALLVVSAMACSSRDEPAEVASRFLLGGWVAPEGEDAEVTETFSETLRSFVVTSEQELTELLSSFDLVRVRGSLQILNQSNFDEVVVVAAYYMWRPLKGDPLSIGRVVVKGTDVRIDLELEEKPQGREAPFLMAPLQIAALAREDLPRGGAVRFQFSVNGRPGGSQSVRLD